MVTPVAAETGDWRRRDLVVIGASAGGVHALPVLLSRLPGELPAAVLVVQHMMPKPTGMLADILGRTSALPVDWARDGEPVEPRRVYLAPPDHHLLVDSGHRVVVEQGPRENYSRPSINRLFRAAAAHYGSRSIGVVLTGTLDDGVAGAAAIKACHGLILVQDPANAEYAELPKHVVDAVEADHVVRLDELPVLIAHLTAEPAPPSPPVVAVVREAELDRTGFATPAVMADAGPQTPFSCPSCAGPLWQLGAGGSTSYRCFVGHTFSPQALLRGQSAEIERSLWTAVRALESRASTWDSLARDARQRGHELSAVDYEQRGREEHEHAARARDFLLGLQRHHEP